MGKDICDSTWENKTYVHMKFGHFLGLWSFIILCLNIVNHINEMSITSRAHNEESNAIYRTHIA